MTTSAASNSVLGDKNDKLSTSFSEEPSLNKSNKNTLIDSSKKSFEDKEDQQHVKFGALPTIDKKEKKDFGIDNV
ncbi:hypothetical protein RCL_jg20220.t1 [Rhizophagus clarus]|uniref:Uncharacterized protein n=1 Tax=Rhizophagus clarus TaxID=94130 RepID=A0A8H3QE59_9GLOM|nr:hypothetical protein RCL_jg20220.t1 [Rhizophagus clarus]